MQVVRRLLRNLLNALTVLSLLLALAAAALWVRSYWVGDGFVWKPSDADRAYYRAYVGRGVARVGGGAYPFDRTGHFDYGADRPPTRPTGFHPRCFAARLGFDYHRGSDAQGQPFVDVLFPIWALLLCAAVLPSCRVVSLRRDLRSRRRSAAGACTSCGYDLRATPERCPECGTTSTHRAPLAGRQRY